MTIFILTCAIILFIDCYITDIRRNTYEYVKIEFVLMIIIAICLQYLYSSN